MKIILIKFNGHQPIKRIPQAWNVNNSSDLIKRLMDYDEISKYEQSYYYGEYLERAHKIWVSLESNGVYDNQEDIENIESDFLKDAKRTLYIRG